MTGVAESHGGDNSEATAEEKPAAPAELPVEPVVLPSEEPVKAAVGAEPEVNRTPEEQPPPRPLATGPLAGIRILDLTRLYPGPLATMLMADMGADVIKIEDMISPDYMRNYPPYIGEQSVGYVAMNRSKRSLGLRLSEERGQEVFFDLVRKADIVVEQFRPGVLKKIGLDYVEAIKTNPRIIYVSLTGYGQKGPYAQRAGHDINYIGYAGLLAANRSDSGRPVIPGAQLADTAAGGYMTVIACLSALLARTTSGVGQQVDVSMLDATLPLMSLQLAQFWATGQKVPPGEQPLSGGLAAYGVYECRDGKYVALGALEPKFWDRFCELAGKPHWTGLLYTTDKKGAQLKKEVAALFLSQPRSYWLEQAGEGDYCLTPVLELDEIAGNEHLLARDMIDVQSHPAYGSVKLPGIPLKFSQSRPRPSGAAPLLGEHTVAILGELGYSASRIAELCRLGILVKKE